MIERVNASIPDLATPWRFLAYARRDFRRAVPAGWMLFRARLSGQSQQSWLGHAWLFLPTIAIVLTCVFIQRRSIVEIGATGIPYPAFVLTGLVAWQIFVDAVNAPLRRLDESRRLLTHSDIPHEAMLVAATLDTGLAAVIRLLVVIPIVALFWNLPGWDILLLPVALVSLLAAGLAIGTLLAPIALLFSDMRHALTMVLMLWMFLTPVFYPIPVDRWLWLNPVRPLIEAMRAWMTGGEAPPVGFVAVSTGAGVLLLLAWVFYRLARPFFVERLGS